MSDAAQARVKDGMGRFVGRLVASDAVVWAKLWYTCASVGHRGRSESASRPIPPKFALLKLGGIAGDAYKD